MTFEAGIEEKLEISQEESVVLEKGKEMFSVLFDFVHPGPPVSGVIRIPSLPAFRMTLQPGFNRFRFLLPAKERTYLSEIEVGGRPAGKESFTLHPVNRWFIYLVQHTHTDIGYTRPQTEILPEHLRYIDYALDYCDLTDSYPDDARFRWTCETSWAVREYLRTRPAAQVERLKKRIDEGRIEVTGLLLNGSDLSDEASVALYLQPVREFREKGIPVVSAMQDDINGAPWCLVDYLEGAGIRFFSMAQNTHRARKPFDEPTTFWWESPSGKRILVNRPEHYMWANQLGILTNMETFGKGLFSHLDEIREKGYPYDRYAIHFSGYLTDNAPPSTTACEVVKSWNERYAWPKLRLATLSEFLSYMEKEHSQEMPVIRGAWPDWWMDGFGSAALETAFARMAHEDLLANLGLMSMARMMGKEIPARLFAIRDIVTDDLAFYDEHTFGAAESISDPLTENSVVQWNEKASYAWDAVKQNRILREEIMGLIQDELPKAGVPTVTVFNTLGWERSGTVPVFIDHQVLPEEKEFSIVNDIGKPVPVQLLSHREEGSWWVLDVNQVAPLGYSTFRIKQGNGIRKPPEEKKFGRILENRFYRIVIDPGKGGITSLLDKQLGLELLDPDAPFSAGQFIYERLGQNRHQLEMLKLDDYTRSVLTGVTVSSVREGPVWTSVTLHGQSPECAGPEGVTCEIRLYHSSKKIEWLFSMKKQAVADPEAVYVAFPFHLPGGHIAFGVAGATVVPGKGQIEGSSSDWVGIQDFVSVKNDRAQIVFVSPEIPLVQLGDINLGKFARIADPKTTFVYSWVLNNYWTTNFRAYQEGELKWIYRMTSSSDTSNGFTVQFGRCERAPMPVRVFPATGRDTLTIRRSFLDFSGWHLSLVSARPAANGRDVILQLRETGGIPLSIPVRDPLSSHAGILDTTRARSATEVNVLEEEISPVGPRFQIGPYETRFIKLVY
jgi:hypothetical protein